MPSLDPSDPSSSGREASNDPVDLARRARQARQLNDLRQKSLVSDVAKLLRLAQELNEAVSANPDAMSAPERIRNLTEIEKLAKRVKDKMRYTNNPAPDPFSSPYRSWP